jgi:aromatic-L-amino-acid decarboxylase
MDEKSFTEWSLKAAKWGADYRASLRDRPVRAQTAPGAIAARRSDCPRASPV